MEPDSPPPLPAEPPVHPALGWLLAFLGVSLSASMAYIANAIHQTILHDGEPGSRSHWTGSAEFTRTAFELFGAVFVFGLVALTAGISILRTRRRVNRAVGFVMVLVVLAIFYLGYAVVQAETPG